MFNLGLAILISLLGSVIALRLKLHPLAGLLLLGFLAGPGVLGLVEKNELIGFMAEIGAVLLLFGIGLEVKIEGMLQKGIRAIIIGVIKIALVFAIVYEAALLLGFDMQGALVLGSMLSITSTAIFAVLPKNINIDRNLLLTVLLLEDVFAIMVLSAIPELSGDASLTGLERFLIFIFSFLMLIISYFIIREILKFVIPFFIKSGDKNSLLFTSLALCLMLSVSVRGIGLDAAIGAFIAGNIMASIRSESEIMDTIKPFTAIFSSFFFLSIGMDVRLVSLLANPAPILVFSLVSILGKIAGITGSLYLLGTRGVPAIESGLFMASTGEFSLLIARNSTLAFGMDFLSIISSVVFLSIVLSSLITPKSEVLASAILSKVPSEKRYLFRHLSAYFSEVVREIEPGGKLYNLIRKNSMKLLTWVLVLFMFFIPAFSTLIVKLGEPLDTILRIYSVLSGIAGFMLCIFPIATSSMEIIRGINKAFVFAYGQHEALDRKMMTRVAGILFCFFAGVALTFLFSFLMLPDIYYYFVGLFYLLAGFFMIELLLTIQRIIRDNIKKKRFKKISER